MCKNTHHGGGGGRDYFRLSSPGSLFGSGDTRAEAWGQRAMSGERMDQPSRKQIQRLRLEGV